MLEELKLPYELELFHRDKQTKLAPPELEKVHPLGKSPALSVTPVGASEPIVLAESGFIVQYLSEHFATGTNLVPKRYKEGQEGKFGGETEEWMRYQYFLHYTEGSFMPILVMAVVLGALKSPVVPFFLRPLTSAVANKIFQAYVFPNTKKHLGFLEQQLSTSPNGGGYLCGQNLTSADILISFGLVAAKNEFKNFGTWEGGSPEKSFPRVWAYISKLESEPGYKNSEEKIRSIDQSFKLPGKGAGKL